MSLSEPRSPDRFHCPIAAIPFIFLFYFFYNLVYTPMLITYTLEILPYAIRAKGFALMVRYNPVVLVPPRPLLISRLQRI